MGRVCSIKRKDGRRSVHHSLLTAPMMAANFYGRCQLSGGSRPCIHAMDSTKKRLSLSALAIVAVVVNSGCAYVQGLYGEGKDMASAQAQPAPQVLYSVPTYYAADISAARAYIGAQLPVSQRMALIDVRDATEYRLGHPETARHLPYPRVYQGCQPHPFGAPEAPIRSEDGSQCLYGAQPEREVRLSAAEFWKAAQAVLPYKDMPVAVLCRTRACAVDAANVLARPEMLVEAGLKGKGYTEVYVVREGFVGEPLMATDTSSGQVLSTQKKLEKLQGLAGNTTWYGASPVALDVNGDGKISAADLGGWRNFLGLPYTVSMSPNLLDEASKSYYDLP